MGKERRKTSGRVTLGIEYMREGVRRVMKSEVDKKRGAGTGAKGMEDEEEERKNVRYETGD